MQITILEKARQARIGLSLAATVSLILSLFSSGDMHWWSLVRASEIAGNDAEVRGESVPEKSGMGGCCSCQGPTDKY